ncbi:invasion associated locus B (IalB) protein [mine drainage metagenome]|uniref:Invasion associated locus B (IalB) protein n=1 Tax=mine drainage metagenome TaxID=410659 RepID=A0A1J5PMT3_9ZZZZ
MKQKTKAINAIATLVLCLGASPSYAASPTTTSGVSAQPSETSEVFGDWTVRCVNIQGKTDAKKICEAAVVVTLRGSKQPFAKVAISPVKTAGDVELAVLLPVNISLPSSVDLQSAATKPLAKLDWSRCIQGACLASLGVKRADVVKWAAQPKPMLLSFTSAAMQRVNVPVSVRGMAQAIAALAKMEN